MDDFNRGRREQIEIEPEFLREILGFSIRRGDDGGRAVFGQNSLGNRQRFGSAGRAGYGKDTTPLFEARRQLLQGAAPHRFFERLLKLIH